MRLSAHLSLRGVIAAGIAATALVTAAAGAPSQSTPAAGTIGTIAGGGALAPDGVSATAASLSLLLGVAVNSSGDVYISDASNCAIEKISGGVITRVVGTGTCQHNPYSNDVGDGGPALDAVLYRPAGLALDASGNLYIADSFNCEVRKLDVQSGIIERFAGLGPWYCGAAPGDGGLATNSGVPFPEGVSVDRWGDVYIAEPQQCVIRMVSAGIITTVAGELNECASTGDGGSPLSAKLDTPNGVAVDSSGRLYVAEGCRIRMVASGVITTVAGTGTCSASADGPATSTMLSGPYGLSVDASGALVFSDSYGCVVRWLKGGWITTIAGVPPQVNAGALAPVCGHSGDGGPAAAALVNPVSGVAVDGAGDVYVDEVQESAPGPAYVRVLYGAVPPACSTSTDADCDGDSDFLNPGAGQPCIQDHLGDANNDGYSDADETTRPGAPTCTGAYPPTGGLGLNPAAACPGRDLLGTSAQVAAAKIAQADVNVDGRVNILDLSAAAAHYRESGFRSNPNDSGSEFDQNGDDLINILDLASIALRYNQLVPTC